ncbi:hypothetical protein [Nocardia paucivorans]|uniref:hypothetical protein n=1 Tax=Nocardia paucivorans TaxID=114259 RepID=UPI000309A400|nr:hypothetical protein [Nocardia paucivorans]
MNDTVEAPRPDGNVIVRTVDAALDQLVRLGGTDPLQALSIAARLERGAREAGAHAVVIAVDHGRSWSEIGAAFGISKQAAHQRFARYVQRHPRQGGRR